MSPVLHRGAHRRLWMLGLVVPLFGCAIGRPFSGPGAESLGLGAEDSVLVVVTHAGLHRSRRRSFDRHTRRIMRTMEGYDGFVGYSVRKEILGDEVWTLTVWRDEAALGGFMAREPHRRAMRESSHAIRWLRSTRFHIPSGELPLTWDRALARLERDRPLTSLLARDAR